CHSGAEPKGGLILDTYQALQKGSDNGPVLVAGKPDESRIVQLVEGKEKLVMPPKKAKQPKPEERSLLRTWVAAGAKDDASSLKVAIPDIQPRKPVPSPATCLAYSPDGKHLAVGGHGEVSFVEIGKGEVIHQLADQTGKVTALAYSRDGRSLAVGSG